MIAFSRESISQPPFQRLSLSESSISTVNFRFFKFTSAQCCTISVVQSECEFLNVAVLQFWSHLLWFQVSTVHSVVFQFSTVEFMYRLLLL